MSGIKIKGTGYKLPEKIVTNDDLSRSLDTNDEWIFSRTGIHERHIAQNEESVFTLALEAAKSAIDKATADDIDFSKEKIIAVIVATMTSDYVFPSVACMLQKELGLENNIKAFDISAACTGFVYALQTAYGILNLHKDGYLLVVGSECMSRILNYKDRSTCVLFGDGAGAAVIRHDASQESVFIELSGTYSDSETLYCDISKNGDGYVHMDGGKVYRFATSSLKKAVDMLLKESKLTMDDIDYVVCHQANARIIESVKRKYPGHESKFFMDMESFANTSAASVALALSDMYEKRILKESMKIITVAFGAGLSWNAVLMTI